MPEFAEPCYVEWVRGECKAKLFIVVRQGSAIAGAIWLKVNYVFYTGASRASHILLWAY